MKKENKTPRWHSPFDDSAGVRLRRMGLPGVVETGKSRWPALLAGIGAVALAVFVVLYLRERRKNRDAEYVNVPFDAEETEGPMWWTFRRTPFPMRDIQEWLGHSNFSTTAETYAHLETTAKSGSAKRMEGVIQIVPSLSTGFQALKGA